LSRATGGLDDQNLIAADAESPIGERTDLRSRQRERRLGRIDDDEVVAESLHLGEFERRHRVNESR
jgi:hypothetical protein